MGEEMTSGCKLVESDVFLRPVSFHKQVTSEGEGPLFHLIPVAGLSA